MATIKDVARMAGVSTSTVSYALSGKRPVSQATKDRINDAIETLGFHPQAGARMLASTKTRIIALSAPMHKDTEPTAFMSFVLAIVNEARKHGYDVLLLTETEQEAVDNINRVINTGLVDGVLVMDVDTHDIRADLLRHKDIPSVFLGLPEDSADLSCIDLDFEAATRLAIDTLVEAGHREIAFVGHTRYLYDIEKNFAVRTRAEFHRYADERGLTTAFVYSDVPNVLDSVRAAMPGCSAVILDCAAERTRDFLAELAIDAEVHEPESPMSIIALAGSYDVNATTPPLDAVPLEPERSGKNAVARLLASIESGGEPSVELYTPRFIENGSIIQRGRG